MASAAVAELWRNGNGIFSKITIASIAGLSLSSVDWGDYDNDGDLDLFMAGNRLDTYYTKVYRNDSFGTSLSFVDTGFGLPGVQNAALKTGDFDNDGDLDLLLTGEQSPGSFISTIYRNNEGVFYVDSFSIPGVRAGSISLGDYNSDSKLDILLTGMDVNGIPICKIYKNQITASNAGPSAPTGLTMQADPTDPNYLIFSWQPSTDSSTPQPAISYLLRIGYSSGGSEISSAQAAATGYRKVPQQGYARSSCTWRIKATAVPYGNFYWSVQAIDGAFIGSPWATQNSFNGGRVLAPNGGEVLRAGTETTVFWYSLANSTNTNVFLSTNNGLEWVPLSLAPVLSSLGRLPVVLPVVSSTQCLIKIADVANPALFDVSDNVFSIENTAPYISVTSQMDPTKLQVNSQHMVTWNSSGVENIKIELSTNEGQTWTTIVPSVSASQGYMIITVPNSVAPLCFFRVSSLENSSIYDWNNSPFSIVSLDLLFPHAGDHVMAPPPTSNKLNVTWSVIADGSNNITSLKIYLSVDNGANWTTLTSSAPYLTGLYAGTIPTGTISNECLVRIEDSSDATILDESTGTFVIADLDVTSPNTSVKLMMGKSYPITWTQNGVVGLVKLEYSLAYSSTGTNWTTIADNIPANQGEYLWTVPVVPNASFNTCRIRISRLSQESFNDISDANFTIVYLNLLSPLGGELWYSPISRTVSWDAYGIANSKIEVSMDSGDTWLTVVSSQSTSTGTNNYSWNTAGYNSWSPLLPGDVDNALVRISDTSSSAQDVFTICPAPFTLKQQIQAIYPPNRYSGNVSLPHVTSKPLTLIRGTSYVILWKADSSVDNVSIYYQRGSTTAVAIVASTPCVASTEYNALYGLPEGEQYCAYTWNIPAGLTLATNYRIRIRRYPTVSPSIEDWTDNFTISDVIPAVDFSGDLTEGYTPLDVQFTDLSPNGSAQILSWYWNFGDGNSSTEQHPLHVYQNPGIYSVTLTVDDNVSAPRSLTKPDYIHIMGNFADITLATPEPVNFYVETGGTSEWVDVEVRNTGTADLLITSLQTSNAAFTAQSDFLNIPIAPDETAIIQVQFTAMDSSPLQANLIISSNASGTPSLSVALLGNDVPASVQDLLVTIVDGSAILTWSPVSLSVLGNPVSPDIYILEYNEVAEDFTQAYYYLSATTDTTFTHYLVARYEDTMFYRILAVKDASPDLRQFLLANAERGEKITWKELVLRFSTTAPERLRSFNPRTEASQ